MSSPIIATLLLNGSRNGVPLEGSRCQGMDSSCVAQDERLCDGHHGRIASSLSHQGLIYARFMRHRIFGGWYLAMKTQMLSSSGNDCAQNGRVIGMTGERGLSRPFLQQILLDLNRRDGGAIRKCDLYRGRARGILDADDYSLATRASS